MINNKKIILIEGLPGTGKSSVMQQLAKRYPAVYEFHTKRKKITKQYGFFNKGKRINWINKELKLLEDKLEDIILHSRYISNEKGNLKLNLSKKKMQDCLNLNYPLIFKEGFLGGLIDENSKEYLKNIKILLKNVDTIIFLKLSEKELKVRQLNRLKKRKGEYDDTTSKKRHAIFMKQFKDLTKDLNVIYVSAKPQVKEIVKNIEKIIYRSD